MLIAFTVGNYRSFREPVTLNMTATGLISSDKRLDENAIIPINSDLSLLTSVGIYGANASGKSNLVRALHFMRRFVRLSSKETQAQEPIDVSPYLLEINKEKEPSFFELVFLIEGIPYRYGFEVDSEHVISEWLFYAPTQKETRLFVREEKEIIVGRNFKGARGLTQRTRDNALFLSVAAQFDVPIALSVLSWFSNLSVINGLDDRAYKSITTQAFVDGTLRDEITKLVKNLDTGIQDIGVRKVLRDEINLPEVLSEEVKMILFKNMPEELVGLTAVHSKFDSEGRLIESVPFDMDEESEGTQKLVALAGPILNSLVNGRILVVDEMDARLHTLITRALVELFNSANTNPNHAQLVFTTHDTNLLSKDIFRRDQIWFIEKDRRGASQLYSLIELKERNDASFENGYLQGRYGAIPVLGTLREMIIDDSNDVQSNCRD